MNREKPKAITYIHRLDEARYNGEWNAVPELVRKIRKHAPQRTCIALAAETEYVFAMEKYRQFSGITSTSNPHLNLLNLSERKKLLSEAIKQEDTYPEDAFQAQTCLDLIHWHQGESSTAISNLPVDFAKELAQPESTTKESLKWTKLCALKISYFKGSLFNKENITTGALEVFKSALPILLSLIDNPGQGNESRLWIELFLTGLCTIYSYALKMNFCQKLLSTTLSAFRYWTKFWDSQTSMPYSGRNVLADVDRRYVWKEYYITLSNLFKYELPFPTILSIAYPQAPTISQLRIELKRSETQYENLIMTEISFPKAQGASTEVEEFVEVVVQNWRAFCGTNFKDQELGEGGGETFSRSVLDILYRAAKKTFHSTAILRHLFTLHLAVSEFDLAFKAFDTYMVITKKGKARLEKTGELTEGFDLDDSILKIASEYIKELCRYGSLRWAEKAFKIGQYFEEWLEANHPTTLNDKNQTIPVKQNPISQSYISPLTLALAWRSIGIGYAQWAHTTFDAASRSDIQSRAISCLRKALLPQYENSRNPETLYALGILLAERRQIDAAIKVVKTGLLTSPKNSSHRLVYGERRFAKERKIIPLWHLLALLLSARHEFLSALKSCEGAFEQFDSPQNLFGEVESTESENTYDQNQGVIDEMEIFEKENLLEVKMTQLALIEVLEGPDVAVNASDEILSLYNRCFGDPQTNTESTRGRKLPTTPKTPGGKSVKGSLFSCSSRRPDSSDNADELKKEMKMPTIHVTDDGGGVKRYRSFTVSGADCIKSPKSPNHHHMRSDNTFEHNEDLRGRKRSLSGGASLRQSDARTYDQWKLNSNIKDKRYAPTKLTKRSYSKGSVKFKHNSMTFNEVNNQNDDGSLMPTPIHNFHYPLLHNQSHFIKMPTYFSKNKQKKYKMTILVKIWLLISGFYRRASMYEDAKAAIDEARQLVDFIDTNFPSESSKLLTENQFKLGEGKSVAELWSDVYTELGYLAMAEGSPHSAAVQFENALSHYRDHPSAIVGLSNILMDIYTENLPPPPSVPALILPTPIASSSFSLNSTTPNPFLSSVFEPTKHPSTISTASQVPLGLAVPKTAKVSLRKFSDELFSNPGSICSHENNYKDQSIALLDRLGARDRAFGLLSALTKTGVGWNYCEAWFSLARAYKESGQPEKAREVLWWCVELEEARGVREWVVMSNYGYVL